MADANPQPFPSVDATKYHQHPRSARIDMRDKENSEPQRDSWDSNCSEEMEIDDSIDSNDSRDSLALSSSSESSASQLTDTCATALHSELYNVERGVLSSQVDTGPAKQLRYNTTETNSNGRSNELEGEDIEDEDDDDACSECSGGTVVANDFPEPPQDATEEEMNRYYWEVCYGEQAKSMMEERQQSAAKGLRSAPSKSW
jgi:hypothetical protein